MNNERAVIVFGGGCFWCTEAIFKMLRGVYSVSPGYAGGRTENPTYEEVSMGATGHAEVVRIEYNPSLVKVHDLLTVFFGSHDPTTLNRQGNDMGTQYRSVVFYTTKGQKSETERFIDDINDADMLGGRVVTEVLPLDRFYEAENYHQDYFAKNPNKSYCQIVINPKLEKIQKKFSEFLASQPPVNETALKQKLTPEQYYVMRERGTEAPFSGKLLHESRDGVYACALCGNPLFASSAKFDSGTGWPSFDQALPNAIKEISDDSMGVNRVEIVCSKCGSHLGHVFNDGPTDTHKRYCMNSVCLDLKDEQGIK